ncbi:MAG: hypothetical protein WA125_07735 [Desulfosporosinus sp.]
MNFFAGLGLQEILIAGLGIVAVGFILKKLFKLAITIAIIIIFVYYGLPILQTAMTKY